MLNRVELIGHLAADPEVVQERGKPVTRLRIATNFRFGPPIYHTVLVRGRRGEVAAERLRKGARIHVAGRLRYRKPRNEEEGERCRLAEIVVAGDVLFLDRRGDPERTDDPASIPDEELNIDPDLEYDEVDAPEIHF